MLYGQTIKAKLQMCCLRIDRKTTYFAVAAIAWEVTYNKVNYAETVKTLVKTYCFAMIIPLLLFSFTTTVISLTSDQTS